jgi:hypothetical protein
MERAKRDLLRLPVVLVVTACGLLLPQITAPIYRLKCPEKWKVAVSLNTFSATQFVVFKFLKNVAAKRVDNFFVLGCYVLHHLVRSNELAEFCALSIVRARLSEVVVFVCLDSKQNALELHSPQLQ